MASPLGRVLATFSVICFLFQPCSACDAGSCDLCELEVCGRTDGCEVSNRTCQALYGGFACFGCDGSKQELRTSPPSRPCSTLWDEVACSRSSDCEWAEDSCRARRREGVDCSTEACSSCDEGACSLTHGCMWNASHILPDGQNLLLPLRGTCLERPICSSSDCRGCNVSECVELASECLWELAVCRKRPFPAPQCNGSRCSACGERECGETRGCEWAHEVCLGEFEEPSSGGENSHSSNLSVEMLLRTSGQWRQIRHGGVTDPSERHSEIDPSQGDNSDDESYSPGARRPPGAPAAAAAAGAAAPAAATLPSAPPSGGASSSSRPPESEPEDPDPFTLIAGSCVGLYMALMLCLVSAELREAVRHKFLRRAPEGVAVRAKARVGVVRDVSCMCGRRPRIPVSFQAHRSDGSVVQVTGRLKLSKEMCGREVDVIYAMDDERGFDLLETVENSLDPSCLWLTARAVPLLVPCVPPLIALSVLMNSVMGLIPAFAIGLTLGPICGVLVVPRVCSRRKVTIAKIQSESATV